MKNKFLFKIYFSFFQKKGFTLEKRPIAQGLEYTPDKRNVSSSILLRSNLA